VVGYSKLAASSDWWRAAFLVLFLIFHYAELLPALPQSEVLDSSSMNFIVGLVLSLWSMITFTQGVTPMAYQELRSIDFSLSTHEVVAKACMSASTWISLGWWFSRWVPPTQLQQESTATSHQMHVLSLWARPFCQFLLESSTTALYYWYRHLPLHLPPQSSEKVDLAPQECCLQAVFHIWAARNIVLCISLLSMTTVGLAYMPTRLVVRVIRVTWVLILLFSPTSLPLGLLWDGWYSWDGLKLSCAAGLPLSSGITLDFPWEMRRMIWATQGAFHSTMCNLRPRKRILLDVVALFGLFVDWRALTRVRLATTLDSIFVFIFGFVLTRLLIVQAIPKGVDTRRARGFDEAVRTTMDSELGVARAAPRPQQRKHRGQRKLRQSGVDQAGSQAGSLARPTSQHLLQPEATKGWSSAVEPTLAAATEKPMSPTRPEELKHDVCIICFDAPRTHIFLPCMHFCVCESCASAASSGECLCPCCRAPAVARRVFVT